MFQKAERSVEATVEKQEPGRIFSSSSSVEKPNSRTESPPLSTSSNSSSVKPSSQTESSPFLFSPDFTSTNQRMSLRTPDHPNAKKNVKNMIPIPISRTRSTANYDNDKIDLYKLKSVHRSASTGNLEELQVGLRYMQLMSKTHDEIIAYSRVTQIILLLLSSNQLYLTTFLNYICLFFSYILRTKTNSHILLSRIML